MRIYDLIAKKRDGGTHSREELEAIVNGFVSGEVADYQMAAWMMAVYLRGMTDEETAELRQAVRGGTNIEEELGDVLFAAVKVGRFCGVDPETAVNGTCEKFIRRFRAMEEAAAAEGRSLSDMTLEEMDILWEECKALERKNP